MAKRKQGGRRRDAADEPTPTTTSDGAAATSGTPPSRLRLWLGRLGLAIGVPLVFLLAVEGILRVSGFGYDPHFYARAENSTLVGSNVAFGRTFFPAAIARKPVENLFRDPKPLHTYRIVLLGSSAAIGVPEAAFNFARVLGAMLEDTYTGTRFEVITAGITATNSHVVLPIARESLQYDPDLVLLYVGNNEVIGPYGIQTSRHGAAPGLEAIRASIALRRTRLGQLLQSIVRRVSGQDRAFEQWRGMEMYLDTHVRAGSPELDRIYANYERNLTDIRDAVSDAGARLVVCTVASNLADSPPFGSLHREDLGEDELGDWNTFFRAGEAFLRQGDPAAALENYGRAAAIDDTYAALHFRIGQCHERLGELEPALAALQRARELDTLRFRTDDRLNDIAREIARAGDPDHVSLADCQRAFESGLESVADIPGRELFFEHVHLTFAGNHALASAVFPVVVQALPAEIRRQGPADPAPPSRERCAEILAYTPWNEHAMIDQVVNMMMARPPFTEQLDHREMMAYWNERLAELRAERSPEEAQRIYDRYVAALRARPDDVLLQIKYMMLLSESGNVAAAQNLLQQLLSRLPSQSPLATSEVAQATM